MSKYVLKGNFEEVSAKLKTDFEAGEAQFNASLNAMFKPAAKPAASAPASTTPAAEKQTESWTSLSTRRKPPSFRR